MKAAARTILHVDLDAFYAAVEVRENPELRGRPVVVGANPQGGRGRGVVSAASYEARTFGVHSAMPISRAYRLCPNAVFLPPHGRLYAQVSGRFMDILGRYTDLVEPLSIDEAFLDVTGSRQLFGDGESIARRLKQEVLAEEQLVASVGVAPSKFVAKIASDLEKPDGLVVVPAAGVVEFLRPLPLQRLFGAGPKTLQRLRSIGVTTIGEVAALEEEALAALLSPRMAHHFRELALGRDSRAVVPDREQKSLGREHTFLIDLDDREEVQRTLLGLLEEVTARLRRQGLYGRTVTLKLRDEDFQTVTRSQTLERAVHTTDELWPTVQELLRRADRTRKAIRLVGVSLSQLSGQQAELFTDPQTGAAQRVAQAQDAIRRRFGSDSLRRGRLLRSPGKTTSKDPSTGPDEPNHGKNASS